MLEPGIFQLLSTAPSLVALQQTNVYPVALPETPTLPATTYQVVGGSQAPTFQTGGRQRRRVQFDFYAETYAGAIALRDATIVLLNLFSGALPNGLNILDCWFIQSIDYFESDARQYRCTAEFYFDFNL